MGTAPRHHWIQQPAYARRLRLRARAKGSPEVDQRVLPRLSLLPPFEEPVVVAVYEFLDRTGQRSSGTANWEQASPRPLARAAIPIFSGR